MSTWYQTGTIDVTNGSATVPGTGTAFSANVQIGDALHAPDGKIYEIVSIVSDTILTISPVYLGANQAAQDFVVQPTRGWTKRVLDALDTSNTGVESMLSGPGAGKFPNGTLAQPGVRFTADEDTGLRRVGSNSVALVAGGVDQVSMVGGVASGAAVQSSATDATTGKLLTVGAFGLGSIGAAPFSDANSETTSGNYAAADSSAVSNFPSAFTNGPCSLLVIAGYNANNLTQIATSQNEFGTFIRKYRSNSWGSWCEIVTMDDIGVLNMNGNQIGGESMIIADDAVGAFTPPRNGGFALITGSGDGSDPMYARSGFIFYDVGSSPSIYVNTGWGSGVGTLFAVSTSDVTGTTGTDGNATVAVQPGEVKIENRTGGSKSFQITWL